MTKAADKAYLFERMPVKRAVLRQIVPTIVGQMIVLIYNLADTYFVGLLNEPRQTAAVTVVGPGIRDAHGGLQPLCRGRSQRHGPRAGNEG